MTHLAVNILACQYVGFTQNHLQWPCLYPKKPAHSKSACEIEQTETHTIALPSDLAGTNVTGMCLRVKRHGAPVFATMWAFGQVGSWQTCCV
jgi:hypothetical protein